MSSVCDTAGIMKLPTESVLDSPPSNGITPAAFGSLVVEAVRCAISTQPLQEMEFLPNAEQHGSDEQLSDISILGDIHENREALEAVLSFTNGKG
jgi:hypothetical protein